jgi:ABC-type amino acid transport substrate-binding protein
MDDLKTLLKKHKNLNEDTESEVNILMPLAYPFPNIGTLTILIFVPFAAWFVGRPFTFNDYPLFVGAGTLSSFINPITGIPFLLGLHDIPDNLVGMYLMSTVYTDRIRVVLGAMHLIVLTLLVIYLSAKKVKINTKKLAAGLLVTLGLFVISVIGIRTFLSFTLKNIETKKELVMKLSNSLDTVPTDIIRKPIKNPVALKSRQTRLSRIRMRGKLRVGCTSNNPPYSYFNSYDQLVGMDIDLAHQMAISLQVDLELVIVNDPFMDAGKDYFDIFINGIPLTGSTAEKYQVTDPYTEMTLSLITNKDNRDFDDFENLSALDTFTIAYVYRVELVRKINHYFPQAGAEQINSKGLFFSLPDSIKPEALITSAESGAILTMFYHNQKIVNPLPYTIKIPKVFMIDGEDKEFDRYVNNFIKVKKGDGTIDYLYKHWILGLDVEKKGKRWSIIRDELHWVD